MGPDDSLTFAGGWVLAETAVSKSAPDTGFHLLVQHGLPTLGLVAAVLVVVVDGYWLYTLYRRRGRRDWRMASWGIAVMVLAVLGASAALLELGGAEVALGLIGLLITGVTAIASTTFISNAMAGCMLSSLRVFGPGDYVEVAGRFGRVTHRGLFHTELQTEDSDLVTLPNMLLISQPVKVVRASGTIVSATVSLGYDVAHGAVVEMLKKAASDAGLDEPFVRVIDLGDYSVSYRAAGFLEDLSGLLTTRSRLRMRILKVLHAEGVEILSPTYITQRQMPPQDVVVPEPVGEHREETARLQGLERTPEERMFDKAIKAERVERLRARILLLEQEIIALRGKKGDESGVAEQGIAWRQQRCDVMRAEVEGLESDLNKESSG